LETTTQRLRSIVRFCRRTCCAKLQAPSRCSHLVEFIHAIFFLHARLIAPTRTKNLAFRCCQPQWISPAYRTAKPRCLNDWSCCSPCNFVEEPGGNGRLPFQPNLIILPAAEALFWSMLFYSFLKVFQSPTLSKVSKS
jgi:hypothetical protein